MAQLKNRIEVLEKKLKPVPVYAIVTDPKRITFTIDETPYHFDSMQDFERFKANQSRDIRLIIATNPKGLKPLEL